MTHPIALLRQSHCAANRLFAPCLIRFASSNVASTHDFPGTEVETQKAIELDERVASVALVGAPNAGKSTLLNCLVGARVAAVSRKINTTRRLVRGAYTRDGAQLLLWDTPGVVERHTHSQLGTARRDIATTGWRAALDADVTVVVVDASRGESHFAAVATILQQLGNFLRAREEHYAAQGECKPHALLLALNKCDRVRPRNKLLDATSFFEELLPRAIDPNSESTGSPLAEPIHFVSAYNGRGVDRLRDSLLSHAIPGHFECDPAIATDEEDAEVIEQHIWEKMLHRLHQEVPYQCLIEFEDLRTTDNGSLSASVVIRVPNPRHVPMVVGPKGGIVKWIAETASASCSALLGKQVFLRIRVAVRGGQV